MLTAKEARELVDSIPVPKITEELIERELNYTLMEIKRRAEMGKNKCLLVLPKEVRNDVRLELEFYNRMELRLIKLGYTVEIMSTEKVVRGSIFSLCRVTW